jgi:hypothetical protein
LPTTVTARAIDAPYVLQLNPLPLDRDPLRQAGTDE